MGKLSGIQMLMYFFLYYPCCGPVVALIRRARAVGSVPRFHACRSLRLGTGFAYLDGAAQDNVVETVELIDRLIDGQIEIGWCDFMMKIVHK